MQSSIVSSGFPARHLKSSCPDGHQNFRLQSDVEQFRQNRAVFERAQIISDRVLSIVAVAKGADVLAQHSVPALIKQIEDAGLKGDICIGLNNGATLSPECLQTIISKTKIVPIDIYCGQKTVPTTPAPMYTANPVFLDIDSEPTRIIIFHQPQNEHSAGKLRMYNDIMGYFYHVANQGSQLPAQTLLLDIESRFFAEHGDTRTNGFAELYAELQRKNLDIIGTRWEMVQFKADGTPNYRAEIPASQEFIQELHGKNGFRWLSGGGMLGSSIDLLSLTSVATIHPGTRMEDFQTTIIAEHAGKKWDVSDSVIVLNRSPEHGNGSDQVLRWFQGAIALCFYYGIDNCKKIFDLDSFLRCDISPSFSDELFRGGVRKHFFAGEREKFLDLFWKAFLNPDSIDGADARAAWDNPLTR